MSEEIKPCPFCGSREAEFIWFMAVNDIPFEGYIECKSCETSGPTAQATDQESSDCEARAIAAWNTRHIPEGYALVPIEPTEAMRVAGFRAGDKVGVCSNYEEYGECGHCGHGFDEPDGCGHTAVAAYKAMIAVAQGEV